MYRWRQDGFGTLATPPASVQTALQNASNQYGVPLPLLESVAQTECQLQSLRGKLCRGTGPHADHASK